ncbi:MAG TPA: tetrahydrofolate dehydrogenase/cyclohydrolase catalytic domain-containing protein [Clostridia bacterium]|nr:tetrahydrofolate dehydrogenase/cyclohydrolase catalytic domain-containing protein [Clostridia bacterium]
MAKLLKGAEVVSALNDKIKSDVAALQLRGVTPTLAILRVGEKPDDLAYERGAIKRAETVGVAVKQIVLPETVSQEELLAEIAKINQDDTIHGCLMLRPLPKHIDDQRAREALLPEKDIDGITDGSLAGVFTGTKRGFPPCTAQACMEILDYYGIDPAGKTAVVIGRSLVIGKPVAMMLLQKHATVTICHTRTKDMPSVTRRAEILIVAAGREGVVGAEYVSAGQTVLDVGINFNAEGKMVGDADFAAVEPIVSAITPVPGGVGTVTTSVLMAHVVEAAKRSLERA